MSTIAKSITLVALVGVSGTAATMTNANNKPMNVSTNAKAPVQCSKRIVIKASPATVWNVLTNIDGWATWQTKISKPILNGPLQPGTTFDWKTDGSGIHSTIHTVDPHQHFGWTGKTMGIYAVHNWTLTEVPGGTQVLVDETMEGFLARLLKTWFNKNLSSDMEFWLEQLKTQSEK